jgi:hypothetical protein
MAVHLERTEGEIYFLRRYLPAEAGADFPPEQSGLPIDKVEKELV